TEDFDLDAALAEAEREPITKPGDLWLLGDHRLLCGDSTNPDDVARLLDGKLASLFATDPPYLVDYTGGDHPPSRANQGKANRNKHWDAYKDPETSIDFFEGFLRVGLEHCQPKAGGLSVARYQAAAAGGGSEVAPLSWTPERWG